MIENSPTLQRWVQREDKSPEGTAEQPTQFSRPFGTYPCICTAQR